MTTNTLIGPDFSQYGYDFVLSTSQATINSGLLEYLVQGAQQPCGYYCFIVDASGVGTTMISLDDLLSKTGGVNPFDIPAGAPTTDPRFEALMSARFAVGVKLQIGLPSDMSGRASPQVVELNHSANHMVLNPYCSAFEVIEYTPAGGWSPEATWNVWTQSPGLPWYIPTQVGLTTSFLDTTLNTPYFNENQDKKAAILAQLENLGSNSYSLQQLVLDLDNVLMQGMPTFEASLEGRRALAILKENFINLWNSSTNGIGPPMIGVAALVQTPNLSQFQMTSFKQIVNKFRIADGQPAVTTLDYLCMIDSHKSPDPTSLIWNWIPPQNVDNNVGAVAIYRQTFFRYLLDQVLAQVYPACIMANVNLTPIDNQGNCNYNYSFSPGQIPQKYGITAVKDGEGVITIGYKSSTSASANMSGFDYQLTIQPRYGCDVKVHDKTTIKIDQHLWVIIVLKVGNLASIQNAKAYDMLVSDYYDLSTDANGNLKLTLDSTKHEQTDNFIDPADRTTYQVAINIINDIHSKINAPASLDFSAIDLNGPQHFIFPGANVVAY